MVSLTLIAPSRLHFGLSSFGDAGRRQFGGVGVMVEQPALRLTAVDCDAFRVSGPGAERAAEFARRWTRSQGASLPRCCLTIEQAIPEHMGLGSGTQLALGVATMLRALTGAASDSPEELANSVGRGLRSAVGTYGFLFGGLIVELGKLPDETISPLEFRLDFPEEWRFVLLTLGGAMGLAGAEEAGAFDTLPPVPAAVTQTLLSEAHEHLVPAVAAADFEAFADSVFRYGRLAGECFAAHQGGPYNGPLITQLVEEVRGAGYAGVGQSSWGPTVFAAAPSQQAADQLAGHIQATWSQSLDIVVTRGANQGAQLLVHSPNNELVAA